jgi:protein-disulfide isomerase
MRFYEKINFWKFIVIILVIIVLLIVFPEKDGTISSSFAKAKAHQFLEENLPEDAEFEIKEVIEKNQIFEIPTMFGNETLNFYMSKDGVYFFPEGIVLSQTNSITANAVSDPTRYDVSADDDPSMGSLNAPVTIVEFSDYECPYCARFWSDTLPLIKSEYVDKGLVRFVFRDMPADYHLNSRKAAEASECADDQGMFWQYHDLLYENYASLSEKKFVQYADDLRLDIEQFSSCVNSGKYSQEVQDDLFSAIELGLRGTPSFFVNGLKVEGAWPFEDFKAVIDGELGNANN